MKISTIRHSLSHILAQAVLEVFPKAKLGTGPDTDTGFYYDFELPRTVTPEDLKIIEKRMQEIIKRGGEFKQYSLSIEEAKKKLADAGQTFKIEIVEDLAKSGEKEVSFYKTGSEFEDLCTGPHVETTKDIPKGSFKLDKFSAAYWRADEKRESMQRIYGLAFESNAQLKEFLHMREESAKRDHRKLGKELELFTFADEVGAGLVLWQPNGAVIREELERLAKEWEFLDGYKRVSTPHIAKEELYLRSGHLPYYADSMFPPMEMGNEKYYLQAMNCPHHHMIYKSRPRSYKELPLRLAEYGMVYRLEKSGELNGLMRVRGLCMNDAHIYVAPEQVRDEFIKVIKLHERYYKLFGFTDIKFRLSKHSKEGLGKKYVDDEKAWVDSEEQIRQAMIKTGIDFYEEEDEAAFYGPKVDIQAKSAIGKEDTIGTTQLDFAVPERFELKFNDKNGKEVTPYCIHRSPLATHERFIAFLIEHFAGAFPPWLAPVQVAILPVNEVHRKYCEKLEKDLLGKFVRTVYLDSDGDTLGKRIRYAETQKIPYMIVVGDKELEADELNVRSLKTKKRDTVDRKKFIKDLLAEIADRSL